MKIENECVTLFESTNSAIWAEKELSKANIQVRIVPVPKHLSSQCGVCIKIYCDDKNEVINTLNEKEIKYLDIITLTK